MRTSLTEVRPSKSVVAVFIIALTLAAGVLTNANVQDRTSRASEVMALVREGSAHYLDRDFEKAIDPYQKALDLVYH